MTGMADTAHCPGCGEEIGTVEIRALTAAHANTKQKFWVCPACETILAGT